MLKRNPVSFAVPTFFALVFLTLMIAFADLKAPRIQLALAAILCSCISACIASLVLAKRFHNDGAIMVPGLVLTGIYLTLSFSASLLFAFVAYLDWHVFAVFEIIAFLALSFLTASLLSLGSHKISMPNAQSQSNDSPS